MTSVYALFVCVRVCVRRDEGHTRSHVRIGEVLLGKQQQQERPFMTSGADLLPSIQFLTQRFLHLVR